MSTTEEELAQAEATLRQWPEYDWLTRTDTQWFRIGEVADQLGMSRETVRAMCERRDIPGAVLYGQQLGWRVPRSGLMRHLATFQRGRGRQGAAG
jgi:excisionase family DNA binding protein